MEERCAPPAFPGLETGLTRMLKYETACVEQDGVAQWAILLAYNLWFAEVGRGDTMGKYPEDVMAARSYGIAVKISYRRI